MGTHCLSRILRGLALFALVLFGGDIVVDEIADLHGEHCVTQSSQSGGHDEKGPCSHCSCATHSGTIVVADANVSIAVDPGTTAFFELRMLDRVPKLAFAIEHPPQLA